MKKIVISVLVILLSVLTYFFIFDDIQIKNWKNKNFEDIKNLDKTLYKKIGETVELNNQEYPENIGKLEESIEGLKIAKEKYANKLNYISENVELGVVQVKEYKIERLWIALQKYAKKENVELKLEVLDTSKTGIYDLSVTLVGEYMGIMDFVYDVEKDDTLGFKILNFKLVPSTKVNVETSSETDENKTTNTTTTVVSVNKLQATFKIEDVGIEFN